MSQLGGESITDIEWVEAREAAKHPYNGQESLPTKNDPSQILIMLKLRDSALKWGLTFFTLMAVIY